MSAEQERAKAIAKAAAKAAAALAARMICKSPCRPALAEAKRVNALGSIALKKVALHEQSLQCAPVLKTKKLSATPIYINLAARTDRRRSMEFQLSRAGLIGCRLEASTIDDADSKVVTRMWDSTLNTQYDTRTLPAKLVMSPGERGCSMSHAVLWHACAARGDSGAPMLILEDDAELCTGFATRCSRLITAVEESFREPQRRACLLYLGGEVMAWRDERHAIKPALGLKEAEYLYQTSSYIIWPAAARMLLTCLPINAPVDVWLSRMFLERRLRALVARPRLAWQAAPYENGNIVHTNVFDD